MIFDDYNHKSKTYEICDRLNMLIKDYNTSIERGDNKRNNIDDFQYGCIAGLQLARNIIIQA